MIQDAIAVVRGSRREELARAFIEWVGTPEAQLRAAREMYRLPARTDLSMDSLPAWARRVRSEMVVEPMDWDRVARDGAKWMTYWDRNVRGRGSGR